MLRLFIRAGNHAMCRRAWAARRAQRLSTTVAALDRVCTAEDMPGALGTLDRSVRRMENERVQEKASEDPEKLGPMLENWGAIIYGCFRWRGPTLAN